MSKEKSSSEEAIEALHEICIEQIGEEYRVLKKSDDGGNHLVVAFEKQAPPNVHNLIPGSFMGWRVIILITPEGYLEVFHPIKET